MAPTVFACQACRTIVGDTFHPVVKDGVNSTVSLSVVANLSASQDLEFEKSGYYAGCTFKSLSCKDCKTQIGRCYQTTPASLDSIRGKYTLDTNLLNGYQLGSGNDFLGGGAAPQPTSGSSSSPSPDVNQKQMMYMLLSFNERLTQVESVVSTPALTHQQPQHNLLVDQSQTQSRMHTSPAIPMLTNQADSNRSFRNTNTGGSSGTSNNYSQRRSNSANEASPNRFTRSSLSPAASKSSPDSNVSTPVGSSRSKRPATRNGNGSASKKPKKK